MLSLHLVIVVPGQAFIASPKIVSQNSLVKPCINRQPFDLSASLRYGIAMPPLFCCAPGDWPRLSNAQLPFSGLTIVSPRLAPRTTCTNVPMLSCSHNAYHRLLSPSWLSPRPTAARSPVMGAACDASLRPRTSSKPALLGTLVVRPPTEPPSLLLSSCLAAAARAPPFMGILVTANSPFAGSTFAASCLATHPPLKDSCATKLPATSLAKSLATPPLKSTLVASSPTTATATARTILALPRMGTAIVKSPAITRV
jgi:hypothetical protein